MRSRSRQVSLVVVFAIVAAHLAKTTTRETCLERLLMSELLRCSVGCLIVLFFPWVLLTEQKATDMLGGDDDEGIPLRPD